MQNPKDSGSYKGCSSYVDFRELLEKEKDIDAIKIMTPDHLHATVAIASMKKGKHVVTHKPIANRIYEGKLTIDTARKTGLSTHLLAWSRRPGYDVAKNWINAGFIGTLKEIHNWSNRPMWPQWQAIPADKPPVPKGFRLVIVAWSGPGPAISSQFHSCSLPRMVRLWRRKYCRHGTLQPVPSFPCFQYRYSCHKCRGICNNYLHTS